MFVQLDTYELIVNLYDPTVSAEQRDGAKQV